MAEYLVTGWVKRRFSTYIDAENDDEARRIAADELDQYTVRELVDWDVQVRRQEQWDS